jgi:hypothetical protein
VALGNQRLGNGKAYDTRTDHGDFSGNVMNHRAPLP